HNPTIYFSFGIIFCLCKEKRLCRIAKRLQENGNQHCQFIIGTVYSDLTLCIPQSTSYITFGNQLHIIQQLLDQNSVYRFVNDSGKSGNNNRKSVPPHLL